MNQKELTAKLKQLDKLKAEASKNKKDQDVIKVALMEYLKDSGSESVSVGKRTIGKKVSSHGIETTIIGVKVTAATNDLVKELLDLGKNNLLSINAKKALLFQLQEQSNNDIRPLLEKHGIKVVEKYTIDIK